MTNQTALAITSAIFCMLSPKSASAEPSVCRPAVVLQGEPKLVKNIKVLLKKRGIENTKTPDCPAIQAKIERKEEKLILWMQDPYGRVSERAISDASSAAALLESWARSDLTETSWMLDPEPTSQPASAPASQPKPAEEPRRLRFYADDPGPSPEDEIPYDDTPKYKWWQTSDRGFVKLGHGLSLSSELSFGLSGSSGFGVKAMGCKLYGPLCVGTLARVGSMNGANKAFGDVELIVNVPLKLKNLWIAPGFGAGVGWIRADTLLKDVFIVPETLQPVINSSGGLRAELLLHFVTPMSPEFLFEAGGALGLATMRGADDGGAKLGEIVLYDLSETMIRAFIGVRYKVY